MIGDNPAARLLALLESGQQFEKEKNAREVWYYLLNVERGNDSLLMSRLGTAMNLPSQIIQLIDTNFPNQVESYDYWSRRVKKAFFQQNLNGKWESFSSHIDQHTIMYLRLSADLIETNTSTTLLGDDTLSELRTQVNQILEEVLESDLDADLKTFLVRTLQRIVVAIDEYHLSGATPIVDAVEIAFGHAFFDSKYKETISNTSLGQKLVAVLTSVASAVTISLGVPKLPEEFQQLVERLGSTTPS